MWDGGDLGAGGVGWGGQSGERWISAIPIILGISVRTNGLLLFMDPGEWALKPSVAWSWFGDPSDCTRLH